MYIHRIAVRYITEHHRQLAPTGGSLKLLDRIYGPIISSNFLSIISAKAIIFSTFIDIIGSVGLVRQPNHAVLPANTSNLPNVVITVHFDQAIAHLFASLIFVFKKVLITASSALTPNTASASTTAFDGFP